MDKVTLEIAIDRDLAEKPSGTVWMSASKPSGC
jgi:hypothetical protein